MTTKELRELLAKATPGPWDDSGTDVWAKNKAGEYVGPLATFATRYEDAALVVALRNEAPALLDRVEALEAGLRQIIENEGGCTNEVPADGIRPCSERYADRECWCGPCVARALLRDGEGSR